MLRNNNNIEKMLESHSYALRFKNNKMMCISLTLCSHNFFHTSVHRHNRQLPKNSTSCEFLDADY